MKILAVEFSAPQRSVAVVEVNGGSQRDAAPCPSEIRNPKSEIVRGRGEGGCPPATPFFQLSEVVDSGPGWIRAIELVEAALREARLEREQIECLALGLGPGTYTGLRAAIALAQGWQLARGVKLLGLGSAEILAAQAQAEGLRGVINVVIDAQRNEFYLARYELVDGVVAGALAPDCARWGVPPSGGSDRIEPGRPTKGWREVEPLRLASRAEVEERARAGEPLIGPEVTRWFPAGRLLFPRAAMLGRLAAARNDFVPGEKLEPVYLRETTFVKAPPARTIPL